MKIFISHSTKDLKIVEEFKKLVEARGIEAYVAVKDVRPGDVLWDKIERNIKTSNCLVAIMTRYGSLSRTLENELGVAKVNKIRIMPIVEEGVNPKGVLEGIEYVKLDKDHPARTLENVASYLGRLKKEKEAESNFIGILLLAGLALFVLMSRTD